MRDAACASWIAIASREDFVFLTGDLGFKALEPLQEKARHRFINAGVAEQNMVSVAAGLASEGLAPWVYSIAPFTFARPFEQIRNDVCLHRLPVKIVGNGGGFGYGVMGATHHALEDYGVLLTLQNMQAYIPAFDEDVHPIVQKMSLSEEPGYLRLGRCEKPKGFVPSAYAPWRRMTTGKGPLVVCVGTIAGTLLAPALAMEESLRPEIWVVTELPLAKTLPPADFLAALEVRKHLHVVEEHVARGSAGEELAAWILASGIALNRFKHFCVTGYLSGRYGSQAFHRRENGLSPEDIFKGLQT